MTFEEWWNSQGPDGFGSTKHAARLAWEAATRRTTNMVMPMTCTCYEYQCPCHEKAKELQKFKEWVHAWLDGQGVPHDPYPEETAQHGCRVGGRIRWLVANRFKQ